MEIIMKLRVIALLVLVLAFTGCPKPAGSAGDTKVSTAAIEGVTAPVLGQAPDNTVTETAQYTGTITWLPPHNPFRGSTVYTATITLTAKPGFTLAGVAENFFTVAGATSVTNSAGSGTVSAVFPRTAATLTRVSLAAIPGVTAPATHQFLDTTVTETDQYTGTITWWGRNGFNDEGDGRKRFANSTVYTATITLTAKPGFTFVGVAENFFTVAGATSVTNSAGSGTVRAVFPRTGA